MKTKCEQCGLEECENDDSCMWRSMKDASREKKASNYDQSKAILDKKGIKYREISASSQLIVDDWNFWPSTGKFYNPKTGKKGRGVFNFLKKIQQ